MYYFGTPETTIAKSLLGELHLPRLSTGEHITIGSSLGIGVGPFGEALETCLCSDLVCFVPNDCALFPNAWPEFADPVAIDDSPRDNDMALVGAIRIAEDLGLAGQIIINDDANSLPNPTNWTGQVIIGSNTPNPIILSPDSAAPYTAPYYTAKSSVLGGGAVGLAHVDQPLVPERGVPLDDLELGLRELDRLLQDLIGNIELAKVVQGRAYGDAQDSTMIKLKVLGQRTSIKHHPPSVRGGAEVFELDGADEGLNDVGGHGRR